jgi:K+/H+ antiporter YhaU regulatory subunit KhtT
VPPDLVGRTIGDTDFRRRTGLSILVVVRDDGTARGLRVLPEPSLVLQPGDAFVVMGPSDRIDALLGGAATPPAGP